MGKTETSGDPVITHGDDDEWVAAAITRIEGHLAALQSQADHIDAGVHDLQRQGAEILAVLQPLRDHPEAVAKGLSLLDPGAGVRKFLGSRHPKGGKV
jgi:hypothetical protein